MIHSGFESLCGEHLLSGVELTSEARDGEPCGACLFKLDGVTYKAVEDPDDGYRNYCRNLEISAAEPFYKFPEIKVFCHMMEDDNYENNDVLVIRDFVSGKAILEVGTKNTDDYYPYCHFKYMPENMSCNQRAVNREEGKNE